MEYDHLACIMKKFYNYIWHLCVCIHACTYVTDRKHTDREYLTGLELLNTMNKLHGVTNPIFVCCNTSARACVSQKSDKNQTYHYYKYLTTSQIYDYMCVVCTRMYIKL